MKNPLTFRAQCLSSRTSKNNPILRPISEINAAVQAIFLLAQVL